MTRSIRIPHLAAALVVLLAAVLTPEMSRAATADEVAASAASDVKIVEFAPSGPWGSTDEYMTLENTGTTTVFLNFWEITWCRPGQPARKVANISTVLGPGQHLVFGGSGYTGAADILYNQNMPDDGGWLIEDASGSHIDGVGLTAGMACTEGLPASSCLWNLGMTAARTLGDTNNNAADCTCQLRGL